ncbi:hypothetical protein GCM10027610_005060 [Dactylosporangium cerinum]
MTLHYRRPNFFLLALYFAAGLGIIYASQTGWELRILFIPLGSTALLVLGAVVVLFALWSLRQAFRPNPVTIEQAGLRLRVAGINRGCRGARSTPSFSSRTSTPATTPAPTA